jgi:HK97 family phage portal protein
VKLRLIAKAAVQALSSIWGTSSSGPARALPGRVTGWINEPFAGAWQRGMEVESLAGLTAFSAVYACISRIANDVAKLKPLLMAQQGAIWSLAPDNSPHWLVLRRPNGFQNRIQFLAFWLTCKLLFGNAYALKARDGRGMVARLYLLDPRRVTPMVSPNGDVYYNLGNDDLAQIPAGLIVPASEIIHDRMNCLWHPLVGVAPIYACGISATQGLKIQGNSAQFFRNMSRPSGILTAPGTIDDPTADRLKRDWENNFGGENIGKLAILGDGLTYEAMTIPAEQAQLIDQLKWTVEDVARAFSMPLYKIGAGQMPTNNNVEALNQQYYSDCLQVHIESIELCLDEGLAVPAGTGVELDLSGLIRMDQSAQMKMLTDAVGGTIMAPNEARARVNLPPKAGGDALYLQQQNFSLEALAKRDALDDPFATSGAAPAPAPAPAEDDKAARAVAKLLETIEKGLEHV